MFAILRAALTLSLFAAAGAARAECNYPRFDFFPEKNGGVTVDMVAIAGTPCTHNFGEGPGYRFTSVDVSLRPEHGRVVKQGATRFVYTPKAGYMGKDAYMFRICARKGEQIGCSAIAFLVEIRS